MTATGRHDMRRHTIIKQEGFVRAPQVVKPEVLEPKLLSPAGERPDSVVTGKNNEAASSGKLLAAVTDKPMEIIEAEKQNKALPVGAGGPKAK